ncbi:MAG: sirohydrochlorin nickelochelatase [Methanobrevibacter sp.]|jgi:sirohydrochlorin cobaltochelatase|nr:sirohydrochlorin nickelochelatase [Candidatus Methanovirga basalitermitum]
MDSNSKSGDNIGVLLLSHGSTLPFASAVFNEIAEKFKNISDYPVEIGYMKVSKPTISQAVHNLSLKSVDKIIAIPIFLADGIHTLVDIPLILGMKKKSIDPRTPDGVYPEGHYLNHLDDIDFDGKIVLLDCIGPDPFILQIVKNKVADVFKDSESLNKDNTGIILISHGSRLKYNSEFINELLRMFKEKTGYKTTLGFMELTNPSIPIAINEFSKSNDFENLIAVPIFIAPGMHTKRDIPKILKLPSDIKSKIGHDHHHDHSHSHEDVEMRFDGKIIYLDPIGCDPLLIDIIKQRIDAETNSTIIFK